VKRGKNPNDRRREPLSVEKKSAALFGQIPKMDASSVLVNGLEGMKEPGGATSWPCSMNS
jgi:hypothetical protein